MSEICEVRSGWGFPNVEQGNKSGELPFYKVSDMNIIGNETLMNIANNFISAKTAKDLGCKPAPSGTIIFPKIGATILTNKKRILSQASCYDNNVVGLVPNENIDPYFLYYYLQKIDLAIFCDFSGALPSIRKTTLEKHMLCVPPLAEQKRIVAILDKFEAITNDLQSGLPAEIEARRKQYEYYRNKLLSFKKAVA